MTDIRHQLARIDSLRIVTPNLAAEARGPLGLATLVFVVIVIVVMGGYVAEGYTM